MRDEGPGRGAPNLRGPVFSLSLFASPSLSTHLPILGPDGPPIPAGRPGQGTPGGGGGRGGGRHGGGGSRCVVGNGVTVHARRRRVLVQRRAGAVAVIALVVTSVTATQERVGLEGAGEQERAGGRSHRQRQQPDDGGARPAWPGAVEGARRRPPGEGEVGGQGGHGEEWRARARGEPRALGSPRGRGRASLRLFLFSFFARRPRPARSPLFRPLPPPPHQKNPWAPACPSGRAPPSPPPPPPPRMTCRLPPPRRAQRRERESAESGADGGMRGGGRSLALPFFPSEALFPLPPRRHTPPPPRTRPPTSPRRRPKSRPRAR